MKRFASLTSFERAAISSLLKSNGARHGSAGHSRHWRKPVPVWCVVDKTAPFARVYFTDPYSFDDWRRVFERLRGDSRFAFRRQIGVLSDRT